MLSVPGQPAREQPCNIAITSSSSFTLSLGANNPDTGDTPPAPYKSVIGMADSNSPSSEDSPGSDTYTHHFESPAAVYSPTSPNLDAFTPAAETRASSGSGSGSGAVRAPKAKAGRTPSRYDWTKHMPTIKKLYIDEDKTLKEVLQIMARDHDFVVTARMVKTRLKKWGYAKNVSVSSDEVEQLMGLIVEAESHGDVRQASSHEVTLATGRTVGLDRVAAHLRRKRIPTNVVAKVTQQSLARVHRARSPSPAVELPPELRTPEFIFSGVNAYVRDHTARHDLGRAKRLIELNSLADRKISSLFNSVRYLYTHDNAPEAFALLRTAPKGIRDIVDADSPTLARHVFMFVAHLLGMPAAGGDRPELLSTVKALVRFTAAAVAEAHPSWSATHPLRRVLDLLASADDAALLEIAVRAWRCLLVSYESALDVSAQDLLLASWLDLGESAGFAALPFAHLEASLWRAYEHHRGLLGECAPATVRQLFWLAELERQRAAAYGDDDDERQRRLFHQALEACAGAPPASMLIAEYNCAYYLAGIYKRRGERELAEQYMRMCIDKCTEADGAETATVLSVTAELRAWYAEWEDVRRIEEMREFMESTMADMKLEDVEAVPSS